MRRLVLLLLAILCAGCSSSDTLEGAGGELLVQPERIDFPPTYLGHAREAAITVENTGRSLQRIELQVDPPFSLESAAIEVAGGERRQLRVRFEPAGEAEVEGVVRLSNGIDLPLRGSGLPVPACPASDSCRTITFDPETGECAERRASDGTSCGDACFDGFCEEGSCRGMARSCDDGNACTDDACDTASGCVHENTAASCPGDSDPCRSPICDENDGCGFAEAEDGTPCGPANCTTSHVCLQGSCTTVTTPDGGACGEETPCQEQGNCVEGRCIQKEPVVLQPLWSQPAAPGTALHFDGTIDLQGNVYWAECTFESCDLVAVGPQGLQRYRETLFVADVGRVPTGGVSLGGDLLISSLTPNRLEARRSSDGGSTWSLDLPAAISTALGTPIGQGRWVDEAAPPVITKDLVIVALDGFQRDGGEIVRQGGWVVAAERATGGVRWVWSASGRFTGLVGARDGSVTFGLQAHDAAPTDGGSLVMLGADGKQRWRKPTPFQAPLATLGGLLVQATGEIRTMEEGGLHHRLPVLVPTFPRRTPLLGGRNLFLFGLPLEPCDVGTCPVWEPHLFQFDPATGEELWRIGLPSAHTSEPVLTSEQAVLYAYPEAVDGGRRRTWLTEVGADRSTVFSCALPDGGRYDGATALHLGQWITSDDANGVVSSFGVQKRVHPSNGWVTAGGTPERTGNPR